MKNLRQQDNRNQMVEQKTSKAWMAALEPPLRAIADTLGPDHQEGRA